MHGLAFQKILRAANDSMARKGKDYCWERKRSWTHSGLKDIEWEVGQNTHSQTKENERGKWGERKGR